MVVNSPLQMHVHAPRVHVPKAEQNNAWQGRTTRRDQFTEVEVVREQDAPLAFGLREDLRITDAVQSLFVQVNGIVAELAQERHRTRRETHIGQEPHPIAGARGWTDSSASQATYTREG